MNRDTNQAINLLMDLWRLVGPGTLGATILWNASYHLDPTGGRIPTFNKKWAITKDSILSK